jgi:uncharacterized repeat protein (TIGR02543 family)
MKKIVAAFLIMALTATSFAVSFSTSDLGGGKMRLSFNVPSGEVLRGVALRLCPTAGTAQIASFSDVVVYPPFNTFPDYAFSFPVGYGVGVGHPLANPIGPGVPSFPITSCYSLCLGVLDQTGNQGGATGSGVLCEIQYTGIVGTAQIQIEGDTLRGGPVVGDNVTQPVLPISQTLVTGYCLTVSVTACGYVITPGEGTFCNLTGLVAITTVPCAGYQFVNWTGTCVGNIANPSSPSTTIIMDHDCTLVANFTLAEAIIPPTVTKTTAAPAIYTRVNSGRVETFAASGAVDNLGHAMEYNFTYGDTTTSGWGVATRTKTYTYTAAATYNVTVAARCIAHPTVLSAASAALALTTEEFSSSIDPTAYYAWALYNRPTCWAFPRNCRGDANGRKVGIFWVQAHDLNALKAAYARQDSALQTISYDPDGTGTLPPIPGICADFNKTKVGVYRVTSADLAILKSSYSAYHDSAVPICPLGAGDGHGIIYYTTP